MSVDQRHPHPLDPHGRPRRASAAATSSTGAGRAAGRRVVLVSERALSSSELDRFLAETAPAEVVVVAPASRGPAAPWASDTARERRRARERLERVLWDLRQRGLDATGQVGDADPLQAIDDACRIYHPDAVVVTCPDGDRSGRYARDLLTRGRTRARSRARAVPVRALAALPPAPARLEAA